MHLGGKLHNSKSEKGLVGIISIRGEMSSWSACLSTPYWELSDKS